MARSFTTIVAVSPSASVHLVTLYEGYQPKGEKIDLKTLILPKGGTAVSKPQFNIEKKNG